MSPAKRRLAGLGLALSILAADQWVKWLMIFKIKLMYNGPVDLLPFFALRWTENRGVSLGLLTASSPEMRWMLVLLTAGIALVVLVWMLREKKLGDVLALGLVLGGALGNIRDRYSYGFVVDYADLHFGEFRPFMIFNIADVAITVGVLIILARSFFSRDKRPAPETSAVPDRRDAATASES